MAVPLEVRLVDRPTNTVVIDTHNEGPRQFVVRERAGTVYVGKNQNPQPRNGKTIGYIYNGEFVPRNASVSDAKPEFLSFGTSALVYSHSHDLFKDLCTVFSLPDALKIITLASLKVLKPHIANSRMRAQYERCFISIYYPGVALSANTICKFLNNLGTDSIRRREFYKVRMLKIAKDHHIAIDGSLIQDNSIVNDLSAFSRKAKVKGCQDMSLLYAYDIETNEPICADIFPGNSIDASSYHDFISINNLKKGIIVADKGFPPEAISDILLENKDLHYLTPLKRNDRRIEQYDMYNFEAVFLKNGKAIACKKCKTENNKWLYSFVDAKKAGYEHAAFIENAVKHKNYNQETHANKMESFGTIVFESDEEFPCEVAYVIYEDRWKLELVFRHYKSDLEFDTTNVQGDFSVLGETFVNLISTIITCRILEQFRIAGLNDNNTYAEIMDDLSSAWRTADAPSEPKRSDGCWIHTLKYVHELLEKLELSKPDFEKRDKLKPDRKKIKPEFVGPKRPRGRPKKL
jgi:hypothetical protein